MTSFIESLKKDNRWPLLLLVAALFVGGPNSIDSWTDVIKPLVCEERVEDDGLNEKYEEQLERYEKQQKKYDELLEKYENRTSKFKGLK